MAGAAGNARGWPPRRDEWEAAGDARPRPHGNTYWLLPGRLLAGEHPAAGGAHALPLRLQGLQAAGITCCIDLTGEAGPGRAYQPLPVAGQPARREGYAIADFGVPTPAGMRRVLDAIDAACAAGQAVYVHCRAGIGRTGTVAGCLLVEHGFGGDEALDLVQRKFRAMTKSALVRQSPETAEQRAFVARWQAGAGRA